VKHLQPIIEELLRKHNIPYIKEAIITVIDKFGIEIKGRSDFLIKLNSVFIDIDAKLSASGKLTPGQEIRHPFQLAGADVRVDDLRASNLGLEPGDKIKAPPEIVNEYTAWDWARSISEKPKRIVEVLRRRGNETVKITREVTETRSGKIGASGKRGGGPVGGLAATGLTAYAAYNTVEDLSEAYQESVERIPMPHSSRECQTDRGWWALSRSEVFGGGICVGD
jgi:hypothetical protein